MGEHSDNFKKLKNMRKNQSGLKNTITEIKKKKIHEKESIAD